MIDIKKLREELLAEDFGPVQDATRAAEDTASNANWGRIAAGLSGAISGTHQDTSVFDHMERQGQQRVADAGQRAHAKGAAMGQATQIAEFQRSGEKAQRDLDRENAERDPSSAESVAAAEHTAQITGMDPAKFKGMSAAQLRTMSPFISKQIDAALEERKAANADAQWGRHNAITSAQEDARTRMAAGQKADEKIDADVKDFSKQIPDGAGGFYEQLDRIKGIIAKAPKGDIPGVGPVDGRLPNDVLGIQLQSPDGVELQKYARQMMLAYRNLVTGTGGSSKEMAEIDKAGADLNNEASFMRGLDALEHGYTARMSQIKAGYRPEVVQTYERRNPAFKTAPAPGAAAAGTAAPGTETTKVIGGKTYVQRNGKWFAR